jgi:hypothetical protein
MNMLRGFFQDRLISKNLWPPRLLDLSPSDFFLWGYLKETVHQENPHMLEDLRNNITNAVQGITADVLRCVSWNMCRRMQSGLQQNGGHFQHLL